MKLNLLVLRTPRLEDMRIFYSALGARFENERHGNGPEHYAAKLGNDFVLELYPCLDGVVPDSGLRLGVKVDNIADVLSSIGQSVVPRQTQWGLHAVVSDPDGRTVELAQNPSQANCLV
jgi:lactoylglutathione lyase